MWAGGRAGGRRRAECRLITVLLTSSSRYRNRSGKEGRWLRPASATSPSLHSVVRPLPTANFGAVDSLLVSMAPARKLAITEFLFSMRSYPLQFPRAVNGVDSETEAVSLIVNRQLHSSPWRKWRVFCKADDVAGYTIPRSTWQGRRSFGFCKADSGLSDPGRVNKRTKQACQSGFSALAACPHPATCAGSGSD
jgi:hypothetical protein